MEMNRNRGSVEGVGVGSGAEIDAGLRSFMLGTYNYMALGVAVTALVTLFMASNPDLTYAIAVGPVKWVIFLAVLGLGWFSPRLIFSGSRVMAHACYWSYAALWGVLIAPMIMAFLNIPGGIEDIMRALFISGGMFAGASLFGYVTKKDLSGWGRFLMMAVIGLLIVMVVNLFFLQSSPVSFGISSLVVLLFAGITAYETQMLKSVYLQQATGPAEAVARLSIFGAFMLYGSFITMFIHVLSLIGLMRSE